MLRQLCGIVAPLARHLAADPGRQLDVRRLALQLDLGDDQPGIVAGIDVDFPGAPGMRERKRVFCSTLPCLSSLSASASASGTGYSNSSRESPALALFMVMTAAVSSMIRTRMAARSVSAR